MNHEQLVINNLGLEIANAQVTIADLKAQLELKNRELNQANLTIENLTKENDSLNNAYAKKDARVRVFHQPNGGVSVARAGG